MIHTLSLYSKDFLENTVLATLHKTLLLRLVQKGHPFLWNETPAHCESEEVGASLVMNWM